MQRMTRSWISHRYFAYERQVGQIPTISGNSNKFQSISHNAIDFEYSEQALSVLFMSSTTFAFCFFLVLFHFGPLYIKKTVQDCF